MYSYQFQLKYTEERFYRHIFNFWRKLWQNLPRYVGNISLNILIVIRNGRKMVIAGYNIKGIEISSTIDMYFLLLVSSC